METFLANRRRVLLAAGLLVAALVLAGRYLLHAGTASSTRLPVAPIEVPAATRARTLLYVDVVGAVARPGLYRVPQGTRVADAVSRAGGVTRKANLDLVNLAAPLADGEQVVVPAGVGAAAAGTMDGAAPAAPVSLSTATAEQLEGLPGIGPAMAQRIIDYRTAHGAFHSVDELDAVPGIGPARLAELRKLVVP
jgi:competence protein ComEA